LWDEKRPGPGTRGKPVLSGTSEGYHRRRGRDHARREFRLRCVLLSIFSRVSYPLRPSTRRGNYTRARATPMIRRGALFCAAPRHFGGGCAENGTGRFSEQACEATMGCQRPTRGPIALNGKDKEGSAVAAKRRSTRSRPMRESVRNHVRGSKCVGNGTSGRAKLCSRLTVGGKRCREVKNVSSDPNLLRGRAPALAVFDRPGRSRGS